MIRRFIALDWRATTKISRYIYFTYPLCLLLAGFISSGILVIPLGLWMALVCSADLFSSEEKGELNHLFLVLPITRNQIVNARYVFSLIVMSIGVATGIAVSQIIYYFTSFAMPDALWDIGIEVYIAIIGVSVLTFAVFHLFMFPLLFKMGYQKGKILGVYLPYTLIGIFFLFYIIITRVTGRNFTYELMTLVRENILVVGAGLFALSALIMLLSYRLSRSIFLKRDF